MNGKAIARGEVVVIDEEFGLRVTEIVSQPHRLDAATSTPEAPVMAPAAEPVEQPVPTPEPDFPVEALDAEPQPGA